MRVTRGIAALSLMVVAVLGLSTCASHGDRGSQGPDLLTRSDFAERVTRAAREAGTATFSFSFSQRDSGFLPTGGRGAIRYAEGARVARITLTFPGLGPVEYRWFDDVVYVKNAWATGDAFAQREFSDPSLGLAPGLEVGMVFDGLADAMISFKKVGLWERIGGTVMEPDDPPTEHYEVGIDTAVILGAEQSAEAGGSVPSTRVYHFWVDADDLVRRMRVEGTGISREYELGWELDSDITAPPADQILDESGLDS